MKKQMQISSEQAKRIGEALHIDWNQVDLEQFRQGLMGNKPSYTDPEAGPIYDGVLMTGKVVLDHMQEFPDYFSRLAKLEAEAHAYQSRSRQRSQD